jgi:hypothetical protein
MVAMAAACFVAGMVLSRQVEPSVRVAAVTLAGDIPALRFLPAGDPGPHPVALLAALFARVLLAGMALGWIAAYRGTRPDGDLAMAILVGYAVGQWMPRMF